MPFFKAPTQEDGSCPIFIRAHTWFDARGVARRLYPMESMEALWVRMEMQEEDPPPSADVFELYNREVVQAENYEKGAHKEVTKRLKKQRR